MATPTFNAHCDYFDLAGSALKCVTSNENQAAENASGQNTPGDTIVVDAYGATAAPSAEYEVVDDLASLPVLGDLILAETLAAKTPVATIEVDGTARPVVRGTLSISTQTGSAPRITMSGLAVMASAATARRNFKLPALAAAISPTGRAQDFLGLCTIKKGDSAASPILDYGLSAVNASFPINFTPAAPLGTLLNYDLTGGMATVDYTMNWYAATAPTIVAASTVTLPMDGSDTQTVPVVMTTPKSKTNPQNGYTQYTWQLSFPLIGFDIESSS